jgi:hypothetical protein
MLTHPWHVALFSKEFEDASGWFLDQFQTTCVVSEGDVRKLDLFHAILERKKEWSNDMHSLLTYG